MSQSLQKGIDALLYLSSKKSAGVTEIAEALGVNKSTAFRILDTFVSYNMAEKVKETGKYKLGPAILKLSHQYYSGLSTVAAAKPWLIKISELSGESSHLGVLANNSAVIVDQIIADSRLVVNAKMGGGEPLYASAVGKCLLAFSEEPYQSKMLASITFESFTEKTIKDEAALTAELDDIRLKGYAVDEGELSKDIRCVAAPIFNNRGECRYAIGISGAVSRMPKEAVEAAAAILVKAANAISAELGYIK
ncbi:MAG TPA: IclR family transcriptional regulator [Eubacteriales bacterium]|nr:IclR family transcriptional regulator [Eubacteriales bacterium]